MMSRLLSTSSLRRAERAVQAFLSVSPRRGADLIRMAPRRVAVFRAARRGGISLLEVMFSIGVVMIGLVGIAALLPLGGALARKGAVADAAARMGANAARDFHVRGMADPRNWRCFLLISSDGITPLPGMSFCLDPVFIAAGNELADRANFPLNVRYDPTIQTMRRITLSARNPLNPTAALDATAANSLFVGSDDLVFDLPGDRTLGPLQRFSFQNATATEPLLRASQGHSSWMATIVPKLDRVFTPVTPSNPTGVNPTGAYTLSIIVFDRRPVDRQLFDTSGNKVSEDQVGERVVWVGEFHSGVPAFSGGDIKLELRPARGASGQDDLELRSGNWVMFSGQKFVMNTTTVPPTFAVDPNTNQRVRVAVHKWYRVVNAGEDPEFNGTNWTREITVVGPDWDTANIPITQVTIVRGVVEVLEKTIRLETSSMWSN